MIDSKKKHSFPAITQQIKSKKHLHIKYLWIAAFALPSDKDMYH